MQIPFYIITSDGTKDILAATTWLYNKYWHHVSSQYFSILGHQFPAINWPDNFKAVKIKDGNNTQIWTKEIHDFILKSEPSEYFFFSLDDYLPNALLKLEILEKLFAYAKKHKVGRIALGRLDFEKWNVAEDHGSYNIVKLNQGSPYRLSCQTSIWNREYFLKNFNHSWTPWQLELEGSKNAQNDGWEIIGTDGEWAFSWVEESALSGRWPGMINILGMRPEDVKYLIERDIFNPSKLQYGIWYDTKIPLLSKFQSISKKLTKIPKFSEIGYNFSWKLIKPYIRSKTYRRLLFRYRNIYPS